LSEENLSKDEIKYPEICLPEYYNLYLQYEDIFEGKMTYEGFAEKYGICDTYLPYDYVAFYLTKQNTPAAETARVYMRLVNKPSVSTIAIQGV
jgi:hypothetical protein